MKKMYELIAEHKEMLVSIALTICFTSGLVWITDYTDAAMAVWSKVRYVSYLMFAVLALHTMTGEYLKEKEEHPERSIPALVLNYLREHAYFTVFALVSLAVLAVTHHMQPIVFLMMVIAMADTGFDKHALILFIVHLAFMTGLITLHKFGFQDQVVYTRFTDGTVRYSLGYLFPLEFHGHFLFIAFLYIYLRKKKLLLQDFLMITLFNVLIFEFTDARTDFYVIQFVTCVTLLVNLIGARRVMDHLHLWFWEACAVLSAAVPFVLAYAYREGSAFWDKLDHMLTERISITSRVLKTTGMPVFGKAMRWVGLGFNGWGEEGMEYNWIDFSFVKDSVDYGWIFVILLVIGFVLLIAYEFRKKDIFGVIIIEGLLLSCMVEYHSFMPSVYPLILMMTSFILMPNKEMLSLFRKNK